MGAKDIAARGRLHAANHAECLAGAEALTPTPLNPEGSVKDQTNIDPHRVQSRSSSLQSLQAMSKTTGGLLWPSMYGV